MNLKEDFLVLNSIAHGKDALVAANMKFLGGVPQWNVIFSKKIHDWEVDTIIAFFFFLEVANCLNSNGEPRQIVVDSLQKRYF